MKYFKGILLLVHIIFVYGSSHYNETLITGNISEESIASVIETLIQYHKIMSVENGCLPYRTSKNNHLTQSDLFRRLIDPCRYDKIQRPPRFDANGNSIPVDVYVRTFVFYMQNLDTRDLEFTLQMRFQIRYQDDRMKFSNVGINKTEVIIGEEDLKKELWIPHVFFVNEKSSGILGTQNRDIITAIHPDGTVIISSRIQVSLYCSMEFNKFPLDLQRCKSTIGSWIYNKSDVNLHWEPVNPFTMGSDKILTEYTYMDISLKESVINAFKGLQYGDLIGNYSCLIFTISFDRSLGFYLLNFYFPSIMLVATSWVSFWLQADQTAPRAMLGTTSMLTFITLSSSQTKALPKVSYIKISEIWSIVCALFIFASLIEFAFVNLLWRRKRDLVLDEVSTAQILKQTLTPILRRKSFQLDPEIIKRSHSDSTLNKDPKESLVTKTSYGHRLSIPNPKYSLVAPTTSLKVNKPMKDITIKVTNNGYEENEDNIDGKTRLTHKEIAILLDKSVPYLSIFL
ncbi:pH-sensitive chloride channel 2-like isoform X2 [Chironomus tepperi]|uniref:pH-sensitive chloride channel 2-like isoform X2 n=1 Tax=Chironomus tepperi TaxID=113505 RepID=UPI00391FB504